MMKDERDNIPERYFQEQWDAADTAVDADVAARIKRAVDRAIKPAEKPRKSLYKLATFLCAAACLAAFTVLGLHLYQDRHTPPGALSCIRTEKGQRVSLTLQDGTRIWLNSDSEISFPSFENAASRDVFLSGECYFEVAKDSRKPFMVHTDVYDVTAVGTAFNVRAYKDDESVKTTLIEGEVRVTGAGMDTRLLPDESFTYNRSRGTYAKDISDLSYYDALWHGNELVVPPGTTLEQLTRILERNYNFQFRFTDDRIKGYTFEGVIKNSQFTNVLDVICLSAPVSYKMEGDYVVFSKK
jgi:ferric-dicitrate binding protein FerR (iron transport regulator)